MNRIPGPESELPLAEYSLIGDGRTAALTSSAGAVDWLCLPRFDSAPVFGALIGGDRAGTFSLTVEDRRRTRRRYRENSAVLETTWSVPAGEVTLREGFVVRASRRLVPQVLLVRRLEARGRSTRLRVLFDPRHDLSGERMRAERRPGGVICLRGALALVLRTAPDLSIQPGREQEIMLEPGRPVTFALSVSDRQPAILVDPEAAYGMLEETDRWWQQWAGRMRYRGPHARSVGRSLITLRLLTYAPSGAPIAAPTTSLPEAPGGSRNWDYRFSWPRDASIGIQAFLATGFAEEAHSFLHWLLMASRLTRPRLHVLYTIDGKPGPPEVQLPNVPGYRRSRPVRIGNEAATQHQLDVYGWVVDAAFSLSGTDGGLHRDAWRAVAGLATFVGREWRKSDAGIWEVRGDPAHYVHSKLMGWLALDRAVRMAGANRARPSRIERWRRERDALAAEIRERGFDAARGTYTRTYGSEDLDAAILILPTLEFEPPESPRVRGTVDAIRRELSAGGPLLYRYPPGAEGMEGSEGAFLPCSFWLVAALARSGRWDEAHDLFDELCSRSNEVGLYGEEMDPTSGEHLGNFPQALTHAALIQAALALEASTEE